MVQSVLGGILSAKQAPPVEAFEKQHFKLLIGVDYANFSWTTFSPDQMTGTRSQ